MASAPTHIEAALQAMGMASRTPVNFAFDPQVTWPLDTRSVGVDDAMSLSTGLPYLLCTYRYAVELNVDPNRAWQGASS